MKRSFVIVVMLLVAFAGAFAGETLERTALLILPDEVSPQSPFRAEIQLRWEGESPLRITTWALKDGESTLGDIQVFDEHGREVQMIFPVTLPLIPNGERLEKKGEVLKLGLYVMGWPLFERDGSYYAVATFSHAFSDGKNVRFTTKKRWFKVTGTKRQKWLTSRPAQRDFVALFCCREQFIAWLIYGSLGKKMNLRLTIAIWALAVSGCVGPFKKSVWSPAEVAEWYERWSHPSTVHRGIGYQGSDEAFHYFIARPIDYFVFIRVPRDQLQLENARPRQQVSSASLGVHYWVDPLDGFRKKGPNQPPSVTR